MSKEKQESTAGLKELLGKKCPRSKDHDISEDVLWV